jgi:hypothetical protein
LRCYSRDVSGCSTAPYEFFHIVRNDAVENSNSSSSSTSIAIAREDNALPCTALAAESTEPGDLRFKSPPLTDAKRVESNFYEPWLHGANWATERFETWAQNGRKTPPI